MGSTGLRRWVLNNPLGAPVILAIERKLGLKIAFERFDSTSEWDPNEYVIRVGRGGWTAGFRIFNGGVGATGFSFPNAVMHVSTRSHPRWTDVP